MSPVTQLELTFRCYMYNINVQNHKTTVYTIVNGVITRQKQQISKNVILSSMTMPKCQCTAEQYHIFDICCF